MKEKSKREILTEFKEKHGLIKRLETVQYAIDNIHRDVEKAIIIMKKNKCAFNNTAQIEA